MKQQKKEDMRCKVMENVLITLKKLLNSMTDKELKEMDLWVDNKSGIQAIAIDDNAISIFTKDTELKVNGYRW